MKTVLYLVTAILFFVQTTAARNTPPNTIWPKVFDIQHTKNASSLTITWKANAEVKDIYYTVETSADGVNYKTAAIVLGGFAEQENFTYLFRIKQTQQQKYFRIMQVHSDGTSRIAGEQAL
jgi:hypothetical protein